MSRLIPTPVTDKNGRLTTVHKRADSGIKNGSLASIKPASIGHLRPVEPTVVIKPKALAKDADSICIAREFGLLGTPEDAGNFALKTGREAVTLTEGELYEGLSRGYASQDTAALKGLGISMDDISERITDPYRSRGNMDAVRSGYTIYRRNHNQVVERLQEKGVPALVAEKVLANGLENSHLDQGLTDDQLIELFSRYKMKQTHEKYEPGRVEQDDVIMSFVKGDMPFELSAHPASKLMNIARELHRIHDARALHQREDSEVGLGGRLQDRDYLYRLADKAVEMLDGNYSPLRELDEVVRKHGMEALELHDPRRATMSIFVSAGVSRECGVEAAHYVEKVLDLAKDDIKPDFWGTGSDSWKSSAVATTRNDVYIRNHDLLSLYGAGVPAEESYDLLVNHKLSEEQIMVMRETGVNKTIADGVL